MIPFNKSECAALLEWYRKNGVSYPWTDLEDPWAVLVSEVMLQQTTVRTVRSRFPRWMERFPTPEVLADTPEEDYLREWEGLGYYNRARNLASAAGEITREYGGRVPGSSAALKALPGVGPYIASAVASFAFGEPSAAIDANGRRIAMRLAAAEKWDRALENEFRISLEKLMSGGESCCSPGGLNGAVMQLGQLVCTPSSPDCSSCPLSGSCLARKDGRQEEIPTGTRKNIIRKETSVAVMLDGNSVFMVKRREGIGRGLWVFPVLTDLPGGWVHTRTLTTRIHTYTRYRETLQPEVFQRPGERSSGDRDIPVSTGTAEDSRWISLGDLADLPMPTAYRRIADELILITTSLVPEG